MATSKTQLVLARWTAQSEQIVPPAPVFTTATASAWDWAT